MDQKTFISAIEQICEEKGISKEKVMEAIEIALAAAYKKEYGRKGQNIRVEFNPETGKMKVYQIKLVVKKSMLREEESEEIEESEEEKKIRFNPEKHIMLRDANKLIGQSDIFFKGKKLSKTGKKKFKTEEEVEFSLEVARDFGRIAAQTAKQVITQRIREAEREAIYEEYKQKEGEIMSGIVQRAEKGNVFFDIGKATGVLFPEEQIPKEYYRVGQRMRVYILEVQKDSHGSAILLSRAHPKMITQLFTLEVPEISAGTVKIKSIAREPGSRSKIAVYSNEERVDPIGSMIGQRGTRVQAVINELGGEKIDIVEWSEDLTELISNSLSPAKVINVEIDKKENKAKVTVPEDQLSLAIGVKGQNVRLAHKLTNCKIDIVALKASGEIVKAGNDSNKEKIVSKEKKDEKEAKTKKEGKKEENKTEKTKKKAKKKQKEK